MKLIVHADDLGLSPTVTDGILRCVDDGPVVRASIIVNGTAFRYAVEQARIRERLELAVHLNLVEGEPLSAAGGLDLLVDEAGMLCRSFTSLWRMHATGSSAVRREVTAQVRRELAAQIERFREAVRSDTRLILDSHQHLHLIPFVFATLLDLCEGLPVAQIRTIREPFFVSRSTLGMTSAVGYLKRALLNSLSRPARRALAARGIATPSWFVGVVCTGRMSVRALAAALGRIDRGSAGDTVEVLFHPGGAAPEEASIWTRYPELESYYLSPWRDRESAALRSDELRLCLERYG